MSAAPKTERVDKRWWVTALVLNLASGAIGVLWAGVLVAIGGLAEVSAIFGRGGGDAARAHMVGLGLGFILTAVLVTAGPLLVGTLLAASRRPRAVAVSFAIAASAFVLPWCVIFLG